MSHDKDQAVWFVVQVSFLFIQGLESRKTFHYHMTDQTVTCSKFIMARQDLPVVDF